MQTIHRKDKKKATTFQHSLFVSYSCISIPVDFSASFLFASCSDLITKIIINLMLSSSSSFAWVIVCLVACVSLSQISQFYICAFCLHAHHTGAYKHKKCYIHEISKKKKPFHNILSIGGRSSKILNKMFNVMHTPIQFDTFFSPTFFFIVCYVSHSERL